MTIDILAKCKELNIEYEIEDKLKKQICPNLYISNIQSVPNEKYQYRDYQLKLLQSLCKYGRGVIISPTRSGKSLILAGLCHNIFLNTNKNKINNIIIITPNIQLVQQMYDDFHDYLNDRWNVIKFSSQQDKLNKKNKITFTYKENNIIISNIQWLLIHGDELPYIDVIIQDEVHGAKKGTELSKLIKNVKIAHKFGCTGTLPAKIEDQWNIKGIFGTILDQIQIKELQQKNVLAQVDIIPIKFNHSKKQNFRDTSNAQSSLDILQIAKEEYRKESIYLSTYQPTNKKIADISIGLINQHPTWNILILFDYINSGQSIFSLLNFKNKHYIDGNVDLQLRQDIVEQMNNPNGGHITVGNFKCIGTGLTISRVQAIILVTNQSNVTKVIQAIGRGLKRTQKNILHIFDIFHNYKYSEQHFKNRTELYKQFYNKQLNKDFKVKNISI